MQSIFSRHPLVGFVEDLGVWLAFPKLHYKILLMYLACLTRLLDVSSIPTTWILSMTYSLIPNFLEFSLFSLDFYVELMTLMPNFLEFSFLSLAFYVAITTEL